MTTRLLKMRAKAIGLLRDARGIAAVEFAMVLPLMLTMWLGSIEVTRGVAIDRKVTLTSRTLADLTGQAISLTNSEINNIFDASKAIMLPYPTAGMTARITAVKISAGGAATVEWSRGSGIAPLGTGSSVSLPPALAVPDTQVIWAEVTYRYNPTFGYVLTGDIILKDQNFVRPRQVKSISNPT